MTQARDTIDDALSTAMHTMQTTIATTLGRTPGALAFAQDMFLEHATDYWVADHCMYLWTYWKIYGMPIGSNISMTTLRDNKFWRKCTTQLCWE